MTPSFLYEFIARHSLAVLATTSEEHVPEAAVVGIVVTPDLKIFFDTVSTSRKYKNLLQNPAIAFVIGWEGAQTVQYEGIARIPSDEELEALLSLYFSIFPDGIERRETWKDLVYFVVEPKWIRYSDFELPGTIEEFRF